MSSILGTRLVLRLICLRGVTIVLDQENATTTIASQTTMEVFERNLGCDSYPTSESDARSITLFVTNSEGHPIFFAISRHEPPPTSNQAMSAIQSGLLGPRIGDLLEPFGGALAIVWGVGKTSLNWSKNPLETLREDLRLTVSNQYSSLNSLRGVSTATGYHLECISGNIKSDFWVFSLVSASGLKTFRDLRVELIRESTGGSLIPILGTPNVRIRKCSACSGDLGTQFVMNPGGIAFCSSCASNHSHCDETDGVECPKCEYRFLLGGADACKNCGETFKNSSPLFM